MRNGSSCRAWGGWLGAVGYFALGYILAAIGCTGDWAGVALSFLAAFSILATFFAFVAHAALTLPTTAVFTAFALPSPFIGFATASILTCTFFWLLIGSAP